MNHGSVDQQPSLMEIDDEVHELLGEWKVWNTSDFFGFIRLG
jgi:hypothetical protein